MTTLKITITGRLMVTTPTGNIFQRSGAAEVGTAALRAHVIYEPDGRWHVDAIDVLGSEGGDKTLIELHSDSTGLEGQLWSATLAELMMSDEFAVRCIEAMPEQIFDTLLRVESNAIFDRLSSTLGASN